MDQEQNGFIRGVVLPVFPRIDPITAARLLAWVTAESLDVRFIPVTHVFSDQELADLERNGFRIIGTGANTMHARANQGFQSETEMVVARFPSLRRVEGVSSLVKAINKHHTTPGGTMTKTSYGYPIDWIIGRAYLFGHDPHDVVERTNHVVDMVLSAAALPHPVDSERLEKLCTALLGRPRHPFAVLSVSRYVRDMTQEGVSPTEISDRTQWFIALHDQAKKEEQAAEERSKHVPAEEFELRDSVKGIWIHTDDQWILKSLLTARAHLVVLKSSWGNMLIAAHRDYYDLRAVGEELSRLEPPSPSEGPIWSYIERFTMVANGTGSAPAHPTALPQKIIQRVIVDHIISKRARPLLRLRLAR